MAGVSNSFVLNTNTGIGTNVEGSVESAAALFSEDESGDFVHAASAGSVGMPVTSTSPFAAAFVSASFFCDSMNLLYSIGSFADSLSKYFQIESAVAAHVLGSDESNDDVSNGVEVDAADVFFDKPLI